MAGEMPLRERKKLETRNAIQAAALELFEQDGYDATTIDDIVDRANYSRRTFFRHFDNKDEVVFADVAERLGALRSQLAARRPSKNPIADVREVLTESAVSYARDQPNRPYTDAWKQEPALWSRFVRFTVDWEQALEEFFASELRHREKAVLGPVVAIAMCGVVRAALTERYNWRDLEKALNDSFDLLEQGLATLAKRR